MPQNVKADAGRENRSAELGFALTVDTKKIVRRETCVFSRLTYEVVSRGKWWSDSRSLTTQHLTQCISLTSNWLVIIAAKTVQISIKFGCEASQPFADISCSLAV
jgi:hypothetical protein